MKRQSTVAKLSKTALNALIKFCRTWNCGVILRIEGIEYGFVADQLENLLQTWSQRVSNHRSVPCIRKGWDACQRASKPVSAGFVPFVRNRSNRPFDTTIGQHRGQATFLQSCFG